MTDVNGICEACDDIAPVRDGLCFKCRCRTLGFTFNGAHPGRRGWNEDTVMGTLKEIHEGARENGIEIERAR